MVEHVQERNKLTDSDLRASKHYHFKSDHGERREEGRKGY